MKVRIFNFWTTLSLVMLLMFGTTVSANDDEDENYFPWLGRVGAVYAATNSPQGNEIVVYDRAADGSLRYLERIATGGLGVGPQAQFGNFPDPLGSQGSVIFDEDKQWLYVVNAGSSEISLFKVTRQGLRLVDKVNSGGYFPVSVTVYGNLLYVLNVGGDGNVTGFYRKDGKLLKLKGSTRSLNLGGPQVPDTVFTPAEIRLTAQRDALVVPFKTGTIRVFPLGKEGIPGAGVSSASVGNLPIAIEFDKQGHLFVAEAFGKLAISPRNKTGGAVSSYAINDNGSLTPINASIGNFQFATCWLIRSGDYLYTTNSLSDTISGYKIAEDGSITLLNQDGVLIHTGNDRYPTDMALAGTGENKYLYTTNAIAGTVSIHRINKDGSLLALGEVPGLPVSAGAQGIAAR